jgi:hypothetical protein
MKEQPLRRFARQAELQNDAYGRSDQDGDVVLLHQKRLRPVCVLHGSPEKVRFSSRCLTKNWIPSLRKRSVFCWQRQRRRKTDASDDNDEEAKEELLPF